MPGMITGTAGVSPVRLLHPDPETARDDSRLTELGWSASGRDVVAPPAVFAVELDSPVARVRGVVAVWDVLDPPVAGGLVPHRQTDARAVRRRVKALRTAHLDRDPLLLTHRGGGTVGRVVDGSAVPVYEVTDRQRHVRVVPLPDDAGAVVLQQLAGEAYLVADGHHRLAAAVELRGEGVPSQVTALVVDADDTPLVLGPIHRVLLDEQGRDRVDDDVVAVGAGPLPRGGGGRGRARRRAGRRRLGGAGARRPPLDGDVAAPPPHGRDHAGRARARGHPAVADAPGARHRRGRGRRPGTAP